MSGNTKPKVKTEKKLFQKFISQPLIKLITIALTGIKNLWSMQNALSGIQIYGDMDD